MKITEPQMENFAEVLVIIAARKMEYLTVLWNNLSSNNEFKRLSADEKKTLKGAIENLVSNLDNEIFLSSEEKNLKKINSNLTLSELKMDVKELNACLNDVLKKEYPGLFSECP